MENEFGNARRVEQRRVESEHWRSSIRLQRAESPHSAGPIRGEQNDQNDGEEEINLTTNSKHT